MIGLNLKKDTVQANTFLNIFITTRFITNESKAQRNHVGIYIPHFHLSIAPYIHQFSISVTGRSGNVFVASGVELISHSLLEKLYWT